MIPKALIADIIRFIREPDHPDPASSARTFEALAIETFAAQFEQNRLYRAYCESRGATPDAVTRWEEIPAVPTRVFTCVDLLCGPPQRVFLTSGTTSGPRNTGSGPAKRGRHGFPDLALYDASALMNFADSLLPDLADLDGGRILACALMPPASSLPESSLAYMVDLVVRRLGRAGSGFYIKDHGLDLQGLTMALRAAGEAGEPVLLLGPTSAFVHFFEACQRQRLRLALPPGSRVMDTGGTKRGQSRLPTLTPLRDSFYAACAEWLDVPSDWCVNEYGMTEMGSQFYDHVLRSLTLPPLPSRERDGVRVPPRPRYKTIPHWVRTRILDPETLEPVRAGEAGLLCHVDLANAGSVMAIQTEDLGVAPEATIIDGCEGFEILGRAAGSEARGCSLALDEFLARAGAAPHPSLSPLGERMPR